MSSDSLKQANYPPAMYMVNTEIPEKTQEDNSELLIGNDNQLGNDPKNTYCSICKRNIWSRVDHRPGVCTYLCCCYICLIGGMLGCCFIPFCCDKCKDTYHFCSNCNATIGVNPVL